MESFVDIWKQILPMMLSEVGETAYNVWIREIIPVDMTATEAVLRLPTKMHYEVISGRFTALIKRCLFNVTGLQLAIRYVYDNSPVVNNYIPESAKSVDDATDAPEISYEYTFDSFIIGPTNRFACAAAQAVAKNPGVAYNPLFIYGDAGLGKTHLSTSVAKVVIERGFDVVYESASGMIGDFEAVRFGRDYESHRDERYFDCDLLIIDDLGTDVNNQFTASVIYNVLTSRINSKKSTIINTNLSHNELRGRYADRITSRLFGEFRPLLFTGRDIRRQKISK